MILKVEREYGIQSKASRRRIEYALNAAVIALIQTGGI